MLNLCINARDASATVEIVNEKSGKAFVGA
jgi:hypothetical protein